MFYKKVVLVQISLTANITQYKRIHQNIQRKMASDFRDKNQQGPLVNHNNYSTRKHFIRLKTFAAFIKLVALQSQLTFCTYKVKLLVNIHKKFKTDKLYIHCKKFKTLV